MAIVFKPKTLAEYNSLMQTIIRHREEYQRLRGVHGEGSEEAEEYHGAHFEYFYGTVEVPPLSNFVFQEFMEKEDEHFARMAKAAMAAASALDGSRFSLVAEAFRAMAKQYEKPMVGPAPSLGESGVGCPRYEAAREILAQRLRAIGALEPKNGFNEAADLLLAGELMHVQTWVVLDALAELLPDKK